MTVYCVMSGEARTDLDHVVYASTSKADAEMFAYKNEFYDYSGNLTKSKPNIFGKMRENSLHGTTKTAETSIFRKFFPKNPCQKR